MASPTLFDRNPVVTEIFRTGSSCNARGQEVPVHSAISREFADALYRTVREVRATTALEIGMAHGVASLAMLTALDETTGGRLISVDPNQATQWQSCGVTAISRSHFTARHELIEQPDYLALPELLRRGTEVQFAYIDGWHTFDYVLLDFFYIDRLLPVGGVVAFNDCFMPAVHKVLNVLLSHRRYDELDVGLGLTPVWESRRARLVRAVAQAVGLPQNPAGTLRRQDRYFRKRETWEPPWDFFAGF